MHHRLLVRSGFISTHQFHLLLKCVQTGDVITTWISCYACPGRGVSARALWKKNDGVRYIRLDVRKPMILVRSTPEGRDL